MKLEFSRQNFENPQISSFIKIRLVGDELFHAGREMDMRLSRFSQFCECA